MSVRGLRIALIVSVVLNVFVIGAVTGGVYRWSYAEVPAAIRGGRLRAAGDQLGPQQQAAYRQALRKVVIENQSTAMAARMARARAAAAFTAPEFDRIAVQMALDEARSADFAIRKNAEQAVLDVAATLPPDQRLLLAEGLRRNGPLRYPPNPAPR